MQTITKQHTVSLHVCILVGWLPLLPIHNINANRTVSLNIQHESTDSVYAYVVETWIAYLNYLVTDYYFDDDNECYYCDLGASPIIYIGDANWTTVLVCLSMSASTHTWAAPPHYTKISMTNGDPIEMHWFLVRPKIYLMRRNQFSQSFETLPVAWLWLWH